LIAIGIPLCTAASRRLGGKDPGCVVWDEIVTMPLVFLGLSSSQISDLGVLCVGFVLHRVFDITKPPPARQVERLPEGLGIMADDCVAGLYACAALHLILALVG
jgi:phosphatidylglycerophosphatase A